MCVGSLYPIFNLYSYQKKTKNKKVFQISENGHSENVHF